ncbi:hypothetical protein Tco_0647508, partial [Tanacetum coccineum]
SVLIKPSSLDGKYARKDFHAYTGMEPGTDNEEKDEKQSQDDKTGLGMEKTVKDKAKSKPKSQSSQKVNRKVNWSKSKSTQVNPDKSKSQHVKKYKFEG